MKDMQGDELRLMLQFLALSLAAAFTHKSPLSALEQERAQVDKDIESALAASAASVQAAIAAAAVGIDVFSTPASAAIAACKMSASAVLKSESKRRK